MARRRSIYRRGPPEHATAQQLADLPRLREIWPAVLRYAAARQQRNRWAFDFAAATATRLAAGSWTPSAQQIAIMQRLVRETVLTAQERDSAGIQDHTEAGPMQLELRLAPENGEYRGK